MALKAEHSLLIGLATAAAVGVVYQQNLPSNAQVRASSPNNQHINTSRTVATWEAAAIVAGIAFLAHDPTVFVIGGVTMIALDFGARHANATDNVTGQIAGSVTSTGISANASVGS
jgi:hypothetical protein